MLPSLWSVLFAEALGLLLVRAPRNQVVITHLLITNPSPKHQGYQMPSTFQLISVVEPSRAPRLPAPSLVLGVLVPSFVVSLASVGASRTPSSSAFQASTLGLRRLELRVSGESRTSAGAGLLGDNLFHGNVLFTVQACPGQSHFTYN